jgi:Tfp pilus assembly protein PilV
MHRTLRLTNTTKKEKGFSLVEVLVTIFALGAVLITVIGMFMYGFNLFSRIKQNTLATQIVQEELEFIRNIPFDEISAYVEGTTDFVQNNRNSGERYASYDLVLLNNITSALTLQDDLGDSANIIKVTVTITWDYRGRQMRKDVVTYIAKGGIDREPIG